MFFFKEKKSGIIVKIINEEREPLRILTLVNVIIVVVENTQMINKR